MDGTVESIDFPARRSTTACREEMGPGQERDLVYRIEKVHSGCAGSNCQASSAVRRTTLVLCPCRSAAVSWRRALSMKNVW
jgi:hypothetical protein